ncbi:FHA domain-containing protein [Candidatus Micrarchaeota archaeon]|nr:FHA domain-containing protein [Candidatus Micrarchaeota archaeon]MBU1165656.1 FHA domain-containing protein [Candidatus Micrarchaeota archaeon]MBU1887203.1 FHA domain-containing protein [Candidatus Micrarchaeota archaeon]
MAVKSIRALISDSHEARIHALGFKTLAETICEKCAAPTPSQILSVLEATPSGFVHSHLPGKQLDGEQVANILISLVMQAEKNVFNDKTSVTGVDDEIKSMAGLLTKDNEFISAAKSFDITTMVRVAMESILIADAEKSYLAGSAEDRQLVHLLAVSQTTANPGKKSHADTLLHAILVAREWQELLTAQPAQSEVPMPAESDEKIKPLLALRVTYQKNGGYVSEILFFEKNSITIGRKQDADIPLGHDVFASPDHSRIDFAGPHALLINGTNKNGTFINTRKIDHVPVPLQPGHKIVVGKTVFDVIQVRPEKTEQTDETSCSKGIAESLLHMSRIGECGDIELDENGVKRKIPIFIKPPKRVIFGVHNSDKFPGIRHLGERMPTQCLSPGENFNFSASNAYVNVHLPDAGLGRGEVVMEVGVKCAEIKNNSEIIVFINGKELPPKMSQKLHDGDIIQIGDYISILSMNKKGFDMICDRYRDFGYLDAEFRQRIEMLENAIRCTFDDERKQKKFLSIAVNVLSRLFADINDMPENELLVEYEKRMSNIEFVISKACVSESPEVFFEFMSNNNSLPLFASIAKTIAGKNLRLKPAYPPYNHELADKLAGLARSKKSVCAMMGNIVDALPETICNGTDMRELKKELSMSSRRIRASAVGKINREILNQQGILLWDKGSCVIIAQATCMMQIGNTRGIIVNELDGFEDIFGKTTLGFFSPDTKMILIRGGSEEITEETAYHEVQHLKDAVAGYSDKIRNTYPHLPEEEQKAYTEATAIAAELYHSNYSNRKIMKHLRAYTNKMNRYGIGSKKILDFISDHSGLPLKDALMEFIDNIYLDHIGIKYTQLYDGPSSTPSEIVYKKRFSKYHSRGISFDAPTICHS